MMRSLIQEEEIQTLVKGKCLTGFLVVIELLKSKIVSSLYTKKLKNDIYELPIEIDDNSWTYFGKHKLKLN